MEAYLEVIYLLWNRMGWKLIQSLYIYYGKGWGGSLSRGYISIMEKDGAKAYLEVIYLLWKRMGWKLIQRLYIYYRKGWGRSLSTGYISIMERMGQKAKSINIVVFAATQDLK